MQAIYKNIKNHTPSTQKDRNKKNKLTFDGN